MKNTTISKTYTQLAFFISIDDFDLEEYQNIAFLLSIFLLSMINALVIFSKCERSHTKSNHQTRKSVFSVVLKRKMEKSSVYLSV